MKKLTAPRMDRCIGCHCCSLACARLVHGLHSWACAGIRIRSSGGLTTGFEAALCVACDPAPCAKGCPTGSLTQRLGGGVKQDISLCIRCGVCAKLCPVDAIYLEPGSGLPFLCIHCGRCTSFCPHNCIELTDIPDTARPAPPRSNEDAHRADGNAEIRHADFTHNREPFNGSR